MGFEGAAAFTVCPPKVAMNIQDNWRTVSHVDKLQLRGAERFRV